MSRIRSPTVKASRNRRGGTLGTIKRFLNSWARRPEYFLVPLALGQHAQALARHDEDTFHLATYALFFVLFLVAGIYMATVRSRLQWQNARVDLRHEITFLASMVVLGSIATGGIGFVLLSLLTFQRYVPVAYRWYAAP